MLNVVLKSQGSSHGAATVNCISTLIKLLKSFFLLLITNNLCHRFSLFYVILF